MLVFREDEKIRSYLEGKIIQGVLLSRKEKTESNCPLLGTRAGKSFDDGSLAAFLLIHSLTQHTPL